MNIPSILDIAPYLQDNPDCTCKFIVQAALKSHPPVENRHEHS